MRDVFVRQLLTYARSNQKIILITGDLGFGVLDEYSKKIPNQFINAGVAEQNMTGIATGLALEGHNVFTYSIANFPTLRCLEQIRNDVLYHNANVNIVAIGGGFSYGQLGMSHHATEDIAIMRALPELRIFAPCDETETEHLVAQMIEEPAPSYLRLDKSVVKVKGLENFSKGKLRLMVQGKEVAIVGYGGIVDEAIIAAEQLQTSDISCSVYSAHTIKPFDAKSLIELAKRYNAVITIEEHVSTGGLGSLAADIFMSAETKPKFFDRIYLPDAFSTIVGSQGYLRKYNGLDAQSICHRVYKLLGLSGK
jgi:transketolase